MRICSLPSAAALLAPLTLLAACADSPSPTAPVTPDAPALAISNFPPEDENHTWQGQVYVCEDGAFPTGRTQTFDWVLKRDSDGGVEREGSIVVPDGSCALVTDVGTEGLLRFNAELQLRQEPDAWEVDDILWTYGSHPFNRPPDPAVNFSGRNIKGVSVRNDWGAVITFRTSTRANSSSGSTAPALCTRSQGFWSSNVQAWDGDDDGVPFTTATTFYNSGRTYLQILRLVPARATAYLPLARHFITASLNLRGGSSGSAEVDAALAGAEGYFASAPSGIPTPNESERARLRGWAKTLDQFNAGALGVKSCDN